MSKVLILGAGMVSKPMVQYLLQNKTGIIIASPMKDRADEMINGNPLGSSVYWSMDDAEKLDEMVRDTDMTVSLLPYKFHSAVAKVCLKNRKPLVTTSYVQKEMMELEKEVKKAGLLFLNETGLDPGIDHMSAMKIIDHVHGKGGKVREFYSLCGALPAPEAADNPLGYKFTWSPKGVVLASMNSALYLKKGKQVSIEKKNLFKDRFTMKFDTIGELEVYPNRDSISYMDIYGIPEAETVYRGTYRYKGWCETLDAIKELGMLSDEVKDYSSFSFKNFLSERTGIKSGDLREKTAELLKKGLSSPAIKSFDFLGFFSDEKLDYKETSPFEITSDRMISRMMLRENERDLVILQHMILAEWADGKKEVIKSSMIDYGTLETNTAIARTVALPASVAVKMILDKKITATGVRRPVIPEIYNPILNELKKMGITMKEEYGLPESEMLN
jgi:saccharopine dehydrogenase-like NADP-dependent oxidoreductase